MTTRTWWPADWADEIMPPGRDAPDGFIIDADGHYWLGYAFDAPDASHQEKRYFSEGLDAGDIVEFVCCDDCGEVAVTLMPDGTYTVAGTVPERVTHFSIGGDPDTLADSIPAFVKNWIEVDGRAPEQPETVTVVMAWWSDHIPHKLVVSYDLPCWRPRPYFEQVTAAEARQ